MFEMLLDKLVTFLTWLMVSVNGHFPDPLKLFSIVSSEILIHAQS